MKILYVTSKGGIHDYRFLVKLVKDYDVLLLHYAADDLIPEIKNLYPLKVISQKPFFKAFPIASHLRHFKKIVKDFNPDIVHTGYVWQVGVLAAYADVHPHLSMPWGSDVLIEPGRRYFIRRMVSRVLRNCDHIQCDAEFVKSKIMNDYEVSSDKITVFPWGIDRSQFKPQNKNECRKKLDIPPEKFVIIYNRYLEKVYGVNYMLQAYNKFAEGRDDILLLIASDGSMKNEILNFISTSKLQTKAKLVGSLPNSDMPYILNTADVYISTSLSDGSSLSLLEAIACGLGIVVTDVPSIKEWVSDQNGIVVERKNIKQITDALVTYYSNRDLIGMHGLKNIQIAKERADWDKNYLKLKDIYTKLAGGR